MKVLSNFIIDDKIVELRAEFVGIKVYSDANSGDGDVITLYFTQRDVVIQTLRIEADCSQNCGFIASYIFKKGIK